MSLLPLKSFMQIRADCAKKLVISTSSTGAQAALNLDASVARMGVYGESGEKLWVVSHTEGLHLWEWQAACDEEAPGSCCGSCAKT